MRREFMPSIFLLTNLYQRVGQTSMPFVRKSNHLTKSRWQIITGSHICGAKFHLISDIASSLFLNTSKMICNVFSVGVYFGFTCKS